MSTCLACGYETSEDAKFCANCGEKLTTTESTSIIAALDDQTLTNELSSDDLAALELLPQGSALLVVLKGPAAGARFLLCDDATVAGRDPRSDIFLDDVTVSRAHASFTRDQGSFAIEDRRSLNGTYVNRQLLKERTVLRNGDEVQIGKFKMIFFLGLAGTD